MPSGQPAHRRRMWFWCWCLFLFFFFFFRSLFSSNYNFRTHLCRHMKFMHRHTHTRTRACCVMYERTKRTWRFPRKHLRYICKIESEKRVGRRWKTYGIRWPSSPSTHSSAIFHSDILTFIAIYSRIRLFVCSSVRSFALVQSFVCVILAVNTLCSGPKFASSAAFCLFSFANVDRFQSVRRIYIWFSRMDRTQSRHRLHTFNWLLSIIHFSM